MHFADDRHGYGLAQWTYPSRKEALLAFARERSASVGDCAMQLAFVRQELGAKLLAALRNATSVREASNTIMLQYERPKDQSIEAQDRRISFSQRFYDQYHKTVPPYDHRHGRFSGQSFLLRLRQALPPGEMREQVDLLVLHRKKADRNGP